MKAYFFTIVFVFTLSDSFSQVIVGGNSGSELGDPKKFENWIVTEKMDYQGMYHFGFSEGESMFFLIVDGDSCYAAIKYGEFISGNEFLWHAIPLSNVRIYGNKFFSDQTQGEFKIYDWGTRKSKGLVVSDPWRRKVNQGISEFGFISSKIDVWLKGKYPLTSYRILTESELECMTAADLKIMRNEIFARLGYKFKAGSEMDKYFRSQIWYKPRFENVDHSLTEIDKINIQLILKIEKLKNGSLP